ncbi:hypothetical protein CDAR_315721 [Caerostris darwini]|uniref:Ycf15 n=1 Tax=Caerostris darwini TaxID=1538125 RepID=A0AAV4PTM1_9ARAC|nr:hypothetical protein CDAR_315721 [Caerostris darwini]
MNFNETCFARRRMPSPSIPLLPFRMFERGMEVRSTSSPDPFRFGTSILSRRQTKTKGIDERKGNRHPHPFFRPPPFLVLGVVEHGKFRKLLRSVNTSFH